MNYCSYPTSNNRNPFFLLLVEHLEPKGCHEVTFNLSIKNLIKYRNKVSVLWFHWPNSHWRAGNLLIKFVKICRFFFFLSVASFLGYKLVWSAHNIMPHEMPNSKLELFLRRFLVKRMDLVIGHAKNTLEALKSKLLHPKRYCLAVHGHYEDYYCLSNKDINRCILGFKSADVILFLKSGGKNRTEAENFYCSFLNNRYTNIKFLIVGDKFPNIREEDIFIQGYISDEDLSAYIQLSNYVVLPYGDITTSGAYFLALTLNTPVLAQRTIFFEKHCTEGTAVLFEDEIDLGKKLGLIDQHLLCVDLGKLDALKNEYTWEKSSLIIVEEFKLLTRSTGV